MMPWDDIWGSVVTAGLSLLFAGAFYRQGRVMYRDGLLWSTVNIAFGMAAAFANEGFVPGGWLAVPYYLALSAGSYFLGIGIMTVFRGPKNVKCFRCEYVGYPDETDEPPTPYERTEREAFQKLHWEGHRRRRENAK